MNEICLQLLISAVNQNPVRLVEKMNLHSDAILINLAMRKSDGEAV